MNKTKERYITDKERVQKETERCYLERYYKNDAREIKRRMTDRQKETKRERYQKW